MKYFFLFSVLLFSLSSCTDNLDELDSDVLCREIISFDDMPNSDFLDGYYAELIQEFTLDQLTTCDCSSLLAIQDFKNQRLKFYWNTYMPMNNSCEDLQRDCTFKDDLTPEQIVALYLPKLRYGVENNFISKAEFIILSDFFNDYYINGAVDYDIYWCRLTEADRSSVINQGPAGMPGAFTLTVFQGHSDFIENNASYFKPTPQKAWQWTFVRMIAHKWADSMDICFDGISNNECRSHEAIDTFLD